MASDTLTLTPGPVAARRELLFAYPPGRVSSDYARQGAVLTIGSTAYQQADGSYDLSFEENGARLRWRAAPAAATSWSLAVVLDPPQGSTVAATAFAPATVALTPPGTTLPLFGDSRLEQSLASDATNFGYSAQGFANSARVLSRQRFNFDPSTDNYGVGGDTTTQMLARAPAVFAAMAARGIRYFLFLGGTNDPPNSIAPAVSIANLAAIFALARAFGLSALVCDEMPRGDATFNTAPNTLTATQVKQFSQIREYLRSLADAPGIYLVNTYEAIGNPASTNCQALTVGDLYDGVHPSPKGAFLTGSKVSTVANRIFPENEALLTVNNSGGYDAAENPRGSLVANPILAGSGGTTNTPSGGSLTGTAPASWTNLVTSGAGFTLAYGADTVSNGKSWCQVTVGGTPTAASPSADLLRQVPTAGNMAVGDIVEGICEFEVAAGTANIRQIALVIFDSTNNKSYGDGLNLRSDVISLPAVAYSGILRTPRIVLPSTNLRFSIVIRGFQNQAATLVARFRSLDLRKVI